MSLQQSHEVQLAIYDLSQGMARQLSAQFLGPSHQIDAIPHTGVICYGLEYFFGGGIQCEEPSQLVNFRGGRKVAPVEIDNTTHCFPFLSHNSDGPWA